MIKAVRDPRFLVWKLQTSVRHRAKYLKSRLLSTDAQEKECVVMLHIGRSGSTMLGDVLDQHPDVFWDGEVWREMVKAGLGHGRRQLVARDDFARFMQQRKRLGHRRVYGFEVKFFHIEGLGNGLDQQLSALENAGAKHFIVLQRRNYLRKIASSAKAKLTTRWHQPAGSAPEKKRISLDPRCISLFGRKAPLVDVLHSYDKAFADLRKYLRNRRHLWLTYEEDIDGATMETLGTIVEFLGLAPYTAQVRYGKTNPFPLEETIENFSEVADALSGTRFEWMLRD